MRQLLIPPACLMLGCAVLYSQTDPLSSEAKQAWTRTITNAVRSSRENAGRWLRL